MSNLDHTIAPQMDYQKKYNLRANRNILPTVELSSSHSNLPISSTNNNSLDIGKTIESHKRYTKQGVSTFIKKLFSMINDTHNQHLISWNSSGSSFFICDVNHFANEVLSENFKHSNYSSFVRQLNMYGFHKINKSNRGTRGQIPNEIWEFSHPNFQKNRPDLLKNIKRKIMEPGLLPREAEDIQTSFAKIQTSQNDLLQQFHVLQENFANLLQGFQDMKKVQIRQQIIIGQLAERQGTPITSTSLNILDNNGNHPSVFVTSPSSSSTWNSQPQKQQDLMISSMDQNHVDQLSNFDFPIEMTDTLPPSPAPSALLSPSSPYDDKYDYEHGLSEQNTLNLGYTEQ